MGVELYAFGGALVTALAAYASHLMLKPKIQADARKAWAETDDLIVARLYKHIDRLDADMETMRVEFAKYRLESAKREGEKDRENAKLRGVVERLQKRVSGLEAIFKIHPIPPEMQASLDALNKEQ